MDKEEVKLIADSMLSVEPVICVCGAIVKPKDAGGCYTREEGRSGWIIFCRNRVQSEPEPKPDDPKPQDEPEQAQVLVTPAEIFAECMDEVTREVKILERESESFSSPLEEFRQAAHWLNALERGRFHFSRVKAKAEAEYKKHVDRFWPGIVDAKGPDGKKLYTNDDLRTAALERAIDGDKEALAHRYALEVMKEVERMFMLEIGISGRTYDALRVTVRHEMAMAYKAASLVPGDDPYMDPGEHIHSEMDGEVSREEDLSELFIQDMADPVADERDIRPGGVPPVLRDSLCP